MKNIVIIGNGISGITAARHIRKSGRDNITVISAETKYFFSRTALMYIYMGHMKFEHTKPYEDKFWVKNKINLIYDRVTRVETSRNELMLEKGGELSYDILIIASGSIPNKFGWPGQDLEGVQGLYSYQDLESMELSTRGIRNAVVVGGGLIGVEMVEMLKSRNIDVTFLVREKNFWDVVLPLEESKLINRHIREHHVDLRLSTELKEILSDEQGRVRAITTQDGDEIPCQFVGLTVGVSPNIEFLKDSGINVEKGVLVDPFLQTNLDNVYAIGDCAQFLEPLENRRPIEQVWYTGRMMGEVVAQNICGNKVKYNPGPWFNSAKFFDIEYQTYGHVWSELKEDEAQFYWEHPDGKKCVKIIFNKLNHKFLGINTFGIRMRHSMFDEWLLRGAEIGEVIDNLEYANFDPEFFKSYSNDIRNQFYEQINS